VELSTLLWSPRDGESVMERLATPPWSTDDPLVRALWDKLTAPEHELDLAVLAAQSGISPTAREYYLRALEDARARRQAADAIAALPTEPTEPDDP
jgi:hypothetical protein